MKRYRGITVALVALLTAVPLFGCGNALDGGSDPSGSVIRVVNVAEGEAGDFSPDIFLSICDVDDTTGEITFEPGLTVSNAIVTLRNDSRPNTPEGQSTNSFVTMNRYRVDFTGLNKTVRIPSIDGGGLSLGLQPDQSGSMTVLIIDFATLEHIRDRYPSIGNGESLTLRAHITIWGEDAFRVPVSAEADVTLVVDDYNRC